MFKKFFQNLVRSIGVKAGRKIARDPAIKKRLSTIKKEQNELNKEIEKKKKE